MRINSFFPALLAALLLTSPAACHRESSMSVTAGEAAAVRNLRTLASAQNSFNSANNHFACTIAELATAPGLLDKEMSTGRSAGYIFTIHCLPQTSLPTYQIWATPLQPGIFGANLYCTDEKGVVRRSDHVLDSCSKATPVE